MLARMQWYTEPLGRARLERSSVQGWGAMQQQVHRQVGLRQQLLGRQRHVRLGAAQRAAGGPPGLQPLEVPHVGVLARPARERRHTSEAVQKRHCSLCVGGDAWQGFTHM